MTRTTTVDNKTDVFAVRSQAACVAITESDITSCDQGARARSDAQINGVLCPTVKRFCRNRFARGCGFSYAFRAPSDGRQSFNVRSSRMCAAWVVRDSVLRVARDEKRSFSAVRTIVLGDSSPGRGDVSYVQDPEHARSRKVPSSRKQVSFVHR
eukprot:585481-Pleurochrysis_carterae.AAC.2